MGRVSSPVFIGREAELGQVLALVEQARGGRSSIALVGGEAGVGKTRFVNEVTGAARAGGFRVLEGGCVQLGAEHLPYAPLIEALRLVPTTLADDELATLMGTGREALTAVMPGLRRGGPRVGGESSPGQILEHLLLFLDRLAGLAPLALVVEDIHWADPTTLEFLAFAERNLRETPVVLMATYRSDELHRRHPLRPFLGELERSGRALRLVLEPFDRREVAAQLEGIRGEPLDGDLVSAVFDRSEGNPFLAEELLAAGPAGITDALQDLLLIRFAALSQETQELVRISAIGGASFEAATLAAVAELRTADLDGALREAVDGHVIVPLAGPDRYAFRHSLLREAIYADLLPGQRARLHARYAAAIEADANPSGSDDSHAAELAYHWLEANDLPRAFEASVRAGLAADAVYANADARANYERALDLWDAVPDAPDRSPLDRVDLLFRLAHTTQPSSSTKAREYLRTAIELVDAGVDPPRAALLRASLGALTFLEDPSAVVETRRAIELIPPDPPSPERARALMDLGSMYAILDDPVAAVPILEEALVEARALSSNARGIGRLAALGLDLTEPRRVESVALEHLAISVSLLGDVDRALELVRQERAISLELGIHNRIAESWFAESDVLAAAGRVADSVPPARHGADYAAAHGMAGIQGAISLYFGARSLFSLGRWDEAREDLTLALRTVRHAAALAVIEGALARLDVGADRLSNATRRLDRYRSMVDRSIWPMLIVCHTIPAAELALWSDDPLTARDLVWRALPRLTVGKPPRIANVGPVFALGVRAEADMARTARSRTTTGEDAQSVARAQDLVASLRDLARETARLRPALAQQAEAWLALCEAELVRASGGALPDPWAEAASRFDRLQLPYEQAYALMRRGQSALAAGQPRSGVAESLREAQAIAMHLGARPLLRRLEDLGARAGVRFDPIESSASRPRPPEQAASRNGKRDPLTSRYALTRRELEVLDLLVDGRTDGEIADDLYISKKTVSVHVNNIKGKLGAESRVGIVTAAISRRLVDGPNVPTDLGDAR